MLGPRREEGVREVVGSAVAFRDLLPLLPDYSGYVAFGFVDGGANAADVKGEEEEEVSGRNEYGEEPS